MPRLSRFLCPSCGIQLPADEADPPSRPVCDACGKSAQLWEKADSVLMPLPPPLPVSPVSPTRKRLLVSFLSLIGVLLAVAAFWGVERLRGKATPRAPADETAAQAMANEVVAAKVEAARAHLARQDYPAALKVLDTALATEHATRLDDARLALVQARQGQANVLLDAAVAAVARRDPAKARQLLEEYLAHPYAVQQARATLLLDELTRATADEDAVRLLARLPDAKLAAFAESGRLTDGESLTDEGVRELYRETLRRHLPKELEARARRERARAEREERLRATRGFQEMRAFAENVRKQSREQSRRREAEERALELFFRDTGVNDPARREQTRQSLRDGRGEDFAATVVRKKAQVKKDYRQSKDHDRADEETFDRLVDQELDRLLAEVKAGNGP